MSPMAALSPWYARQRETQLLQFTFTRPLPFLGVFISDAQSESVGYDVLTGMVLVGDGSGDIFVTGSTFEGDSAE